MMGVTMGVFKYFSAAYYRPLPDRDLSCFHLLSVVLRHAVEVTIYVAQALRREVKRSSLSSFTTDGSFESVHGSDE